MQYVEDYIARSLKKLEQSGDMDNNAYKGKPLNFDAYFRSDKKDRAINRYLADAGFVPPKVALLKQIKTLENQYQSEPSAKLLEEIEALKLKYQTSGR